MSLLSYDLRDFPFLASTDFESQGLVVHGPTRTKRTEGESRALAPRATVLRDEGRSLERIGDGLWISHFTVHGLLAGL
ncbi:MAG: hypothetical protein LBJ08_04300 [Bifidobacteriaceae bacterium]|jgi:hypothetical protein|nr:hypothetical protein [Bifidobacteriaceae bacterium]